MQKIIVFDSGIGGFSIVHEIMRQHLPISIEYLADQRYFPYGNKSPAWLESRLGVVASAYASSAISAFVVACNTGTVEGIKALRTKLPCPVIGVEPVIKPLSSYDHALVLATPTTANSIRTRELIAKYGPHLQVYGCSNLASAIENNDNDQVKKELHEISKIVQRENIQALGLSCTHYPLILDQLVSRFPLVHLYDPSTAVVLHLKGSLRVESQQDQAIPLIFYTTGEVIRFKKQVKQYFGTEYPVIRKDL